MNTEKKITDTKENVSGKKSEFEVIDTENSIWSIGPRQDVGH